MVDETPPYDHVILCTGHMIDAAGRKSERFPARAEAAARAAMERSVRALLSNAESGANFIAIAGGASGADLLFHEACGDLAIPSLLRLALPVEPYIEASIAPAGPGWVNRFHKLMERIGPGSIAILDPDVVLPDTLTNGETLNIWQKVNLWMAAEALTLAPQRTLLALWDGKAGDGPGGTEHLVAMAPRLGIDVAPIIRTQPLVAQAGPQV